MEKLGLIYVGGNTTRYALWELNDDRSYRLLESYKEDLKLGKNTDEEFIITEDKIISLITILSYFKEFSDSVDATNIHIILSEFFLRIKNRKEIRERLEKELNIKVTELNSEEELHYDILALSNTMKLTNALVVDISGVSTQLALIRDGKLVNSHLLPLGTLSLTERFRLESQVTKDDHVAMDIFLENEIGQVDWLKDSSINEMIILGGSARAISKIDRKKRRYPVDIIHEYTMQDLDIHTMYKNIIIKNLKQRYAIEGLDKERADILPAALSILDALLRITEIQNIRVSGSGIREGYLFDYMTRQYGKMEDMLDRSISNILSRHNVDKTRAENLYQLTQEIYLAFRGLHKDWENVGDIIKVSSKLRDVGLSIRYYNHDRHNFYIISNSEINGLDHRQIIMSSLAATFSNGLSKETPLLQYGQLINRMDLEMVYDIGICLSISEILLRSNKKKVHLDHIELLNERVRLNLISSHDLHFEIHEAMKLKDQFFEMYDKELEIVYNIRNK
ncbi:hypothetical protein [Proteiniclasticum sp.]|uniref:Ppx/GppA phosphatase family protein n=1 Tax=Proteiniclasticum sp. TaxID=2053595 RepID=UPI002898465C|nr:hypothetical protein [Proteiniclasticum sp.]